jgi:predicted TIM-barrel fold metal-dependent hydrolase
MAQDALPYLIIDADEHSTPPDDAYERYIDPRQRDKAVRTVRAPDGRVETLFAGRPMRMPPKSFQVTFSDAQLSEIGLKGAGNDGASDRDVRNVIPGSLLNRLNPLRGLDAEGRRDFVRRYRALQPLLDNPSDRMAVMDSQGIEATVNYAGPLGLEFEFEHDVEGLYANLRAINRYLANEWKFNCQDRIFTPPFISLASAEHAVAELDAVLRDETPRLVQISSGPAIHRSPFRPELDPFWSRMDEAGIHACSHLASVTFYARQGEEWDERECMLGDMDAFQWVFYYGDRPAMEMVGAAILQGFFSRFPNLRLLLSEQGALWVPYLVRKMDHAYLMGRRATWGKLERRPSEIFRERCAVAPFPEENVDRLVEAVGTEPLVFGSDFPHGEGLPEPSAYLKQLEKLSADQVHALMRGNMGRFLGLAA